MITSKKGSECENIINRLYWEILIVSGVYHSPVSSFFTITLGDIVIALSAGIGVFGSYKLYTRRRNNTNERLRHAFLAEMGMSGDKIYEEASQMRGSELTDSPYLPEENPIVTTVYDDNSDELGGLTSNEIEKITEYYTKAKLVDRRLQRAINESEESSVKLIYIRASLVDLNNLRYEALNAVEAELGEIPIDIEHRSELQGGGDPTLSEIRDRIQLDDE